MSEELAQGKFLGSVLKAVPVADARLTLLRHDEKRIVASHRHAEAYFCVLIYGGYTEHYSERAIKYRPFSLALHPAGYGHWEEIEEARSIFFIIELGTAWREKLHDMIDLQSVKVELRGNDLVWLAMRIFREFADFDEESAPHAESLLYELVAGAARLPAAPETGHAWFGEVVAFLDQNYAEPLSLKTIADIASVHPVTLARVFRAELQQTATEYVNRLRVRRACELILSRGCNLAQVGAECGFQDQSYFTKVFRGITGSTPGAFGQAVWGSLED